MKRLTLLAAARPALVAPVFSVAEVVPDGFSIEPLALPPTLRRAVTVSGPDAMAVHTVAAAGARATTVEQLRAWSAGEWAGRAIDDVARDDPNGFVRWRTDGGFAPPGGESLDRLLARVGAWIESSSPEGAGLALVDSTVVTAAVVHVLGAPSESFWHLDVAPLSLTRLNFDGRAWRLRSLNVGRRLWALGGDGADDV